ncbi:galactose oxidase-like domain-containing protein [Aquabacterium sp. NJ1]|uniref:galactose oxidase-like domain-containing protein n=1 Tax=Aquabacterium sp. NJ1 TaxID=1538295 RepID=UPI001377AAC8|nr:galactose oxidase-like domain-containing protein [Aquabacterium sp. NJ1]
MAANWIKGLFKASVGVTILGGLVFGGWWQWRNQAVSPAEFHLRGKFGPVTPWPIIPIQVSVLSDGRVLAFGTDRQGRQGASEVFDVWNPAKGMGPDAHLVLPNGTGTDIFCSGQIIIPSSGQVLLVGGDRTVNGERNWSSPDINFYDIKAGSIKSAGRTMERPRWYPTVMTLANGEVLILGGRLDPQHYAPIPEIYNPQTGWRTLPGADKDALFGSQNWNYPRAWQTPRGDIFSLNRLGDIYSVKLDGEGSFTKLPQKIFRGHSYLPSLMYAPGKILSIRLGGLTYKIDINQAEPVIQRAAWSGLARFNATATVLPDGRVYISGGSLYNNDASSGLLSNRLSEIWDPATDKWSPGAVAAKARLYHSVALLMQDGTVLTGAGGAGAKNADNNLDAEIYYPPYLFKADGSGQFAPRPAITAVPDFISWAKAFQVKTSAPVGRFTLVKMGSATHAQVYDQRFIELSFKPNGDTYEVSAPINPFVAPPGYYFLFAMDLHGVPSVAKIIRLDTAAS